MFRITHFQTSVVLVALPDQSQPEGAIHVRVESESQGKMHLLADQNLLKHFMKLALAFPLVSTVCAGS